MPGLLSLTWILPLLGAGTIACIPRDRKTAIRMTAAVTSFLCLAISLLVYFGYNIKIGGFQFVERALWIPQLGMSYHVGGDGLNLPMVLLTGFIMFTGVLIAWNIEDRTKEFYGLFLLLVTGVFGVFVSLDLFLLFMFYELAVFPMYLLIGIWGSVRKEYAAMKLTLYLLVASALIFFGLLILYFLSGPAGARTFDIPELANIRFGHTAQMILFPLMFVGFGVLAGMWPLHTWSPVGHVAAPTSVSMLHAGVLMKLGAYGCLRGAIFLFPEGAKAWLPIVAVLAIVNVVYGSMVAMVQKHFKYVIGYSSVSHMGFVVLGLSACNAEAYNGAVLQMFSHGIMTGLLFAIVGRMVYDRTHTLEISELGGLNRIIPFATLAFIVAGMASMGMPGLSGFVAELQILIGVWEAYPVLAALSGIGIVVTAGYILRYIHRVFYGKLDPHFEHLPPITRLEKTAGVILMAVLFIVGLYPPVMTKIIDSGVQPFIRSTFVERLEESPGEERATDFADIDTETETGAAAGEAKASLDGNVEIGKTEPDPADASPGSTTLGASTTDGAPGETVGSAEQPAPGEEGIHGT